MRKSQKMCTFAQAALSQSFAILFVSLADLMQAVL